MTTEAKASAAEHEKLREQLVALSGEELAALLRSLPAANQEALDAAAEADAQRVLDMSDDEFNAELVAIGENPSRWQKWGQATARWCRALADAHRQRREAEEDRDRLAKELAQERAKLQAAARVVNATKEHLSAEVTEPGSTQLAKLRRLHDALDAYDRAAEEDGAGGAGGKT